MIKSKLVKALMLGLCMSALTSSAAFAQATSTNTVKSSEVQVDDALYAKQKDIDQFVFEDHARDIEKMGFMINYTGVVGDLVEIGISPYTDANADYLYGAFGKDNVKVVEFDQSVIYASGVAVDPAAADDATGTGDGTTVKDDMQTDLENGTLVDPVDDGKVYKGSDDVSIQIESVDGVVNDAAPDADPDLISQTTSANTENADIKTVSVADDAVKSGAEDNESGVPAPLMVLAIAGGAALLGGAIILSNKKKVTK
ncbi:MAG: hypothetical protein K0S01_3865 [Herbinix sp.]|nr:hypothetical protein [Herbinix sp.]